MTAMSLYALIVLAPTHSLIRRHCQTYCGGVCIVCYVQWGGGGPRDVSTNTLQIVQCIGVWGKGRLPKLNGDVWVARFNMSWMRIWF